MTASSGRSAHSRPGLSVRLPNAALAQIEPAKLTSYLLKLDHKDGGSKARVFIGQGLSPDEPHGLRAALLRHPLDNAAVALSRTPYGDKYEGRCNLQTPNGANPCIRSLWIIEDGRPPRLVSAYPT